MFTSTLFTIGSLATQLRTLWKQPAPEAPEELSQPGGVLRERKPAKFAVITRAQEDGVPEFLDSPEAGNFGLAIGSQSVRTFPRKDSSLRAVTAPAIPPEVMRAISATLAEHCGRYVAIRSVKKLAAPSAASSAWAQQGRVVVHASHNLPAASIHKASAK